MKQEEVGGVGGRREEQSFKHGHMEESEEEEE
jgi:hypothetical protein